MSLIKSKKLLKIKSILRNLCPELLVFASRVASRTTFYKKEREYLAGNRASNIDQKSILFFAPERCASQYMNRVICQLVEPINYSFVDLPNYHFHSKDKRISMEDGNWICENLSDRGYFFGSLDTISVNCDAELSGYKLLATVRDPRDVLVSSFYSVAYAHTPGSKKFVREAAEARKRGIDWYVTQGWRLDEIREKYKYIAKLREQENSYFWKYEYMMENFSEFIEELFIFLDLDERSDAVKKSLIQAQHDEQTNKSENDILAHKRSGSSNQYLKELSEDSINTLTHYFKEELHIFDYE